MVIINAGGRGKGVFDNSHMYHLRRDISCYVPFFTCAEVKAMKKFSKVMKVIRVECTG